MQTITFSISDDYIELNKLLKASRLVNSGSDAHILIADGIVSVNGEIETRKRRKCRENDEITVDNLITIHITREA